jgi:hypothetical protein
MSENIHCIKKSTAVEINAHATNTLIVHKRIIHIHSLLIFVFSRIRVVGLCLTTLTTWPCQRLGVLATLELDKMAMVQEKVKCFRMILLQTPVYSCLNTRI